MIRRPLRVAALTAVLLLAACATPPTPAADPTPPAQPSSTPKTGPTPTVTTTAHPSASDGTTPSQASQTCSEFGTTHDISSEDPHEMSTMTGASMRVGRHDCFDRYVFELQGGGERPGWTAGYRDPLASQTSGERVQLLGGAALEIIVQAWTVNDYEGRPAEWPPFTGPDDIVTSGFTAIKEARNLYAYEGTTQLALGIDQERPFQIAWFSDPTRLIVDVYTGELVD